MMTKIRYADAPVGRAVSLRHFPRSFAWLLALSLSVTISTRVSAQRSEIAANSLPDAPQAQTPAQTPTQVPRQPATQTAPQPTSSIRGTVSDPNGTVYEGVQVKLAQPAPSTTPPHPERSTTTDSSGQFTFSDVAPGAFTLTISSHGFATQSINGTFRAGETYQAPHIVLIFAGTTSEVEVTASRFEIAQEQLHEEEQQRVLGVIPNFYVVYAPNAAPLTSRQKFHLAWKTIIDPVNITIDLATAGVQQADNDYASYGQGAEGYAKRFGAAYATDVTATMLGGAILPSLLKQDPRYFYKGTGTQRSRIFYALSTAVICKSDEGRWQPNYSAILGSLAAGGIANLYYPAEDRNGAGLTFGNALLGIGGTAVENLFQEFVVRKLTPKLPNYGSPKH
jgi:hypothetical protein